MTDWCDLRLWHCLSDAGEPKALRPQQSVLWPQLFNPIIAACFEIPKLYQQRASAVPSPPGGQAFSFHTTHFVPQVPQAHYDDGRSCCWCEQMWSRWRLFSWRKRTQIRWYQQSCPVFWVFMLVHVGRYDGVSVEGPAETRWSWLAGI